jgi:hypothetical protein
VIDPMAPGGVRMVDAIFLPQTGDTVVVVEGERRPIAETLPDAALDRDAPFFVRGEPVRLRLTPTLALEYTAWETARVIEARELTYLGQIQGAPMYASSTDVANIRTILETLRQERGTHDLDVLLHERRDLRDALIDVQYLYVPLMSVGCVFQPLRQVDNIMDLTRLPALTEFPAGGEVVFAIGSASLLARQLEAALSRAHHLRTSRGSQDQVWFVITYWKDSHQPSGLARRSYRESYLFTVGPDPAAADGSCHEVRMQWLVESSGAREETWHSEPTMRPISLGAIRELLHGLEECP